jgi:uridylate kinase
VSESLWAADERRSSFGFHRRLKRIGKPVAKYKRILLKLSGEAMAGPAGFGVDTTHVAQLAAEIAEVARAGVEFGIVVGGGNFFRGVSAAAQKMDRVTADHMGMLATVLNALALQNALEAAGAATRVMTAIEMRQVAEPFIRRRALRHLEKGRIVIFAAGTSSPYFSTDTAASLRALEMKAEVLAKATRVDGVYDRDPLKHPDAVRYPSITYNDVLASSLGVMDATSIAMCRDNNLPILVFNLNVPGNIMRMSMGETVGTLIHS